MTFGCWRALLSVRCSVADVAFAQTPAKIVRAGLRELRAGENDAALSSLERAARRGAGAGHGAFEAAMSPYFVALDCPANPLKACGPGKAQGDRRQGGKPLDRMRLAFCCEGKPSADTPLAAQDETMFAILAATLGAATLGANPDARGQVCAPALPAFDRAKAAKAAKAAGVEPENLRVWRRPTRAVASAPVANERARRRARAGDLAPVVTDLTSDTPPGWTAIGLPDGSIGYTDALGLEELTPAAICFAQGKGRMADRGHDPARRVNRPFR